MLGPYVRATPVVRNMTGNPVNKLDDYGVKSVIFVLVELKVVVEDHA